MQKARPSRTTKSISSSIFSKSSAGDFSRGKLSLPPQCADRSRVASHSRFKGSLGGQHFDLTQSVFALYRSLCPRTGKAIISTPLNRENY